MYRWASEWHLGVASIKTNQGNLHALLWGKNEEIGNTLAFYIAWLKHKSSWGNKYPGPTGFLSQIRGKRERGEGRGVRKGGGEERRGERGEGQGREEGGEERKRGEGQGGEEGGKEERRGERRGRERREREREREREKRGEKTSGSRWCESHYCATIMEIGV